MVIFVHLAPLFLLIIYSKKSYSAALYYMSIVSRKLRSTYFDYASWKVTEVCYRFR